MHLALNSVVLIDHLVPRRMDSSLCLAGTVRALGGPVSVVCQGPAERIILNSHGTGKVWEGLRKVSQRGGETGRIQHLLAPGTEQGTEAEAGNKPALSQSRGGALCFMEGSSNQ